MRLKQLAHKMSSRAGKNPTANDLSELTAYKPNPLSSGSRCNAFFSGPSVGRILT
jgi:hypothetical protein